MIFIYAIIYITLLIINTYIYKKKVNFNNIIISLWMVTSMLSMFGFYNMFIPNTKTYIYILCFMISFEIFSIFFYKTKFYEKKLIKKNTKTKINNEELDHKMLNIILIILILIMAIFAIQGVKTIICGGSFSDIRDNYLEHKIFSNKLQMFISLVIIPLGHAIGMYTIIELIEKKKINLTFILYLIFLLEILIFTAGRNVIVNFALVLFIAIMDKYNNNILKIIKENRIIISIFIVVLIATILITTQRSLSGKKSIIYNIYCYLVGNIHLLGVYIANPNKYLLTTDNLLYGQILISGFVYPITFILRRFGSNIKAGLYVLYETTQQFYPVSPNTTMNNNVTIIVAALRDFGVIGIFIYSIIFSFFYSYIYKNKQQENNMLNRAIYYHFFKTSIFLLFDYQFGNTGVILTFLYLFIIYKFCINTEIKEEK